MGQTILVADDDPIMHRVLRHYLEQNGYRLLDASTGRQAIEVAAAEQPSLVILDVLMPEMSGLAALRQLKEQAETRHIPVLVVTVNADRTTHLESEVSGAAGFLAKPFRPAELLAKVQELIGKHGVGRREEAR